ESLDLLFEEVAHRFKGRVARRDPGAAGEKDRLDGGVGEQGLQRVADAQGIVGNDCVGDDLMAGSGQQLLETGSARVSRLGAGVADRQNGAPGTLFAAAMMLSDAHPEKSYQPNRATQAEATGYWKRDLCPSPVASSVLRGLDSLSGSGHPARERV